MIINGLKLKDFRNIESLELEPSDGVNVIFGENAQGKTNILESIWMFTGFRSFRTIKDSELVRFGADYASLNMLFNDGRRDSEAEIKITNKRLVKLNGVAFSSPSEMIGKTGAVVFSPEFMTIVKNGPAERRAFLDTAVCVLSPSYPALLRDYTRLVKQRNACLRDEDNPTKSDELAELIEDGLARCADRIVRLRRRYLELLTPVVCDIYSGISSGSEEISVAYRARHNEDGSADLRDLLRQRRATDRIIGTTTVGPHRDDVDILINGLSAREYGSQGQQRSCAVALKLAEAEVEADKTGIKPVILLDDVMSELDVKRQDYILNHISGRQVFITCCEPDAVLRLACGKAFRVENGRISFRTV